MPDTRQITLVAWEDATKPPEDALRRFTEKVEPEPDTGCWLWTGATRKGYGNLRDRDGRSVAAHRFAYEDFVGPIPEGMHVLHLCDVRNCVNPDHLFLGTNADNCADKAMKGRSTRGEANAQAKFTADDVRAIRKRVAAGEAEAALAREYGVRQTTINKIKHGQRWGHV